MSVCPICFFFFSSRRRHTRYWRDWSSDVCSSDLCPARRCRYAPSPPSVPPSMPLRFREAISPDTAAIGGTVTAPSMPLRCRGAISLRRPPEPGRFRAPQEFAGDHDLLHLRGALVDPQRTDFAVELLDLDAPGDTEASEDLHRLVDHPLRGFRGVHLRHRGL